MTIKTIVKYAFIAAIYTVLSLVMGSLSFATIQIRIGELLMVLCLFDKKYVLPLTLGCFITNLIGVLIGINVIPLDIIFGTIATFISGIAMYKLRNIKCFDLPLLALFMPVIINSLIIGLQMAIYIGDVNSFAIVFLSNALWVFLGELISVYILGIILFKPLTSLAKYLESFH